MLKTKYHLPMADDPRRKAARRLQHDLGRYIRFAAPEELEPDTEALRQRLTRDVLGTRSTPEGVVPGSPDPSPASAAFCSGGSSAAMTRSGAEARKAEG